MQRNRGSIIGKTRELWICINKSQWNVQTVSRVMSEFIQAKLSM